MTDDASQTELERQKQLGLERQKLTDAQRQQHDRFCAVLKENETYSTAIAIEAAKVIHQFDGTRKLGQELRYLADRAENDALVALRRSGPTEPKADETAKPVKAEDHAEQSRRSDRDSIRPAETQLHTVAASFDRRHGGTNYEILPQAAEAKTQETAKKEPTAERYSTTGLARRTAEDAAKNAVPQQGATLSPNDVLSRFGNAAAEATSRKREETREQTAKSNYTSADAATRAQSLGGDPATAAQQSAKKESLPDRYDSLCGRRNR